MGQVLSGAPVSDADSPKSPWGWMREAGSAGGAGAPPFHAGPTAGLSSHGTAFGLRAEPANTTRELRKQTSWEGAENYFLAGFLV